MVMAFVPGAARDQSHRDLPITQRERAVHGIAVELVKEPAEPVNAAIELAEKSTDIGIRVAGFRYRFIWINHRDRRKAIGHCFDP